MRRVTILLIPWLYIYSDADAQLSAPNEEIASALRVFLNANEYLKGGLFYNEFMRRQRAFQDALRLNMSSSSSSMPFADVFEPLRNHLFNVIPQSSAGFLQRLYSGYTALVQPYPRGIFDSNQRYRNGFNENITKLAERAIRKVTKQIDPDRPREIPNIGGFGADIGGATLLEGVKNESEHISNTAESTEAPTLTQAPLDDAQIRTSDDYYDYIEHEKSIPESEFSQQSTNEMVNVIEPLEQHHVKLIKTTNLPASFTQIADSSHISISAVHQPATLIRRVPRVQKSSGDRFDVNDDETTAINFRPALGEGESFRRHKKAVYSNKKKMLANSSLSDNIDELIKEINMTEQQAQAFINVVQKILEEELEKRMLLGRLHSKTVILPDENHTPKTVGINTREYRNGDRKENMRMYYSVDDLDEKEQEDEATSNKNLKELITSDMHIEFERNDGVTDEWKPPSDIVSFSEETRRHQRKPTLKLSLPGSHQSGANYRQIEQAEYDKFLSSYQNQRSTEAPLGIGREKLISERTTVSSITPLQQTTPRREKAIGVSAISHSVSNTVENNGGALSPLQIHRISETIQHATSGPRTAFERQVRDFRERLWGNNGFGDIIKALEHANIAFYEQPTYNRYHQS